MHTMDQHTAGKHGNPKIHSHIQVMQYHAVIVGLPQDAALSKGIMGEQEEEVKLV